MCIRDRCHLGDGDSASYQTVVTAKRYDPDVLIEKLECVGHVQNMGSRLKKMKTQKGRTTLTDGKTIGGPLL